MTLDCTQADFLTHDQLIFSLKGGELYVLTLLCDAMRSVRGFHFEKSASSVLTTCVREPGFSVYSFSFGLLNALFFSCFQLMVCDKDYIFLGSRLGNSLLLRISEKGTTKVAIEAAGLSSDDKNGIEVEDLTEDDDDEIIKLKKSRRALDQEEVEVYGSEKKTHFSFKTYMLEVNFFFLFL